MTFCLLGARWKGRRVRLGSQKSIHAISHIAPPTMRLGTRVKEGGSGESRCPLAMQVEDKVSVVRLMSEQQNMCVYILFTSPGAPGRVPSHPWVGRGE